MRAPFATAIAIAVGLIVLAGYFLTLPVLNLASVQGVLIGWAVILAGVATLVGVLNLVSVHWRRLRNRRPDLYSLVLLIAFVASLAVGLVLGPADPRYQKAMLSIQVPVEASLMAVVAVVLVFASLRLFNNRKGLMAVVFLISSVLFLLTSAGVFMVGADPSLVEIHDFLQRLPSAGGRGILLGIALGSLTAGLRILMGADRPYSG